MSRWRKLQELSLPDLFVVLQSAAMLAYAKACLPHFKFDADSASPMLDQSDHTKRTIERAQSLARLVGIAAAHLPIEVSCLQRSIVLKEILRRHSISAALRIGARVESGILAAHAWVEYAGVALNERATDLNDYVPFSRPVQVRFRSTASTPSKGA